MMWSGAFTSFGVMCLAFACDLHCIKASLVLLSEWYRLFTCDYIVPDFFLSFFPFSLPPPPPPPPAPCLLLGGWGEGMGDGGVFRKLGYHVFCCILLLD